MDVHIRASKTYLKKLKIFQENNIKLKLGYLHFDPIPKMFFFNKYLKNLSNL